MNNVIIVSMNCVDITELNVFPFEKDSSLMEIGGYSVTVYQPDLGGLFSRPLLLKMNYTQCQVQIGAEKKVVWVNDRDLCNKLGCMKVHDCFIKLKSGPPKPISTQDPVEFFHCHPKYELPCFSIGETIHILRRKSKPKENSFFDIKEVLSISMGNVEMYEMEALICERGMRDGDSVWESVRSDLIAVIDRYHRFKDSPYIAEAVAWHEERGPSRQDQKFYLLLKRYETDLGECIIENLDLEKATIQMLRAIETLYEEGFACKNLHIDNFKVTKDGDIRLGDLDNLCLWSETSAQATELALGRILCFLHHPEIILEADLSSEEDESDSEVEEMFPAPFSASVQDIQAIRASDPDSIYTLILEGLLQVNPEDRMPLTTAIQALEFDRKESINQTPSDQESSS